QQTRTFWHGRREVAAVWGNGIICWNETAMCIGFLGEHWRQEEAADSADQKHYANGDYAWAQSHERVLNQLKTDEKESKPPCGLMVLWIQKIQIKKKPKPGREDTAY